MSAASLLPVVLGAWMVLPHLAASQPIRGEQAVDLTVEAGTPLRVELESKTPIREGEPIRAVLTHPVYAFDREVLPAGAVVHGYISEVRKPSSSRRAQLYLNGRFRMPKQALIELKSIELTGGRLVPLSTSLAEGFPGVIRLTATPPADDAPDKRKGVVGSAKQHVSESLKQNEVVQSFRSSSGLRSSARKGAKELKRSARGKWSGARTALLSFWPGGRQNLKQGSQFTAELIEPLEFGDASVNSASLSEVGSRPVLDSIVEARLLDGVTSETAEVGSEIRAQLTKPVFSDEGALLWPEGSTIIGEVTQVTPARRIGRNGKLRFRFTKLELASGVGTMIAGSLDAAEVDRRSRMELDSEGGAKLKTSKKRFVLPALSVGAVMVGVPGDEDGVPSGSSAQGMAPGSTGFGPWGSLVALSSRAAAAPIGLWGAGSSIYFNLVRKADELEFPKHTLLEIRFGRPFDSAVSEGAETPSSADTSVGGTHREPPPRKLIVRDE